MSRKRLIIVAVLAIDIIIAIVVVAIILDRQRGGAEEAASAVTSTTGISSPYDFVELPDDVEIERLKEASFVSILLEDENGQLTSYGVSASLPATQSLMEAFSQAEELDADSPETAVVGSTSGEAANAASMSQATITFVLPDREILTFAVDLQTGLATRGARTWQVEGGLGALVEAAILSQG